MRPSANEVLRDPRRVAVGPRRSDAAGANPAVTSDQPARGAALRKLTPVARMPLASAMRRLSDEDVALLAKTLAEPMECVHNKAFARAGAERSLTVPLIHIDDAATAVVGGDPDMPAASSIKTLTAEEETELFLCLNYCRFRAMRIVKAAGTDRLTGDAAAELLRWTRESLRTRAYIIKTNLSLVPAMAKRTRTPGVDLGDLICEGNLALLRSVDKFDCARGFKFSTYACRAILSSFSSSAAKSARYRACFPTEFDPALEKSDESERKRANIEDDCVRGLKHVLADNLACLSIVERRVLEARFDLGQPQAVVTAAPRARTLKQVAELIGVTKERVRQIQNKALDKLREAMEREVLAA